MLKTSGHAFAMFCLVDRLMYKQEAGKTIIRAWT